MTWVQLACILIGIPLLVWRLIAHDDLVPDIVLKSYVLTAGLFGILLAELYPPRSARGFGKALSLIIAIHCAVVAAVVIPELYWPSVRFPPRMVYGVVGAVLFAEWRAALIIFRRLDSVD